MTTLHSILLAIIVINGLFAIVFAIDAWYKPERAIYPKRSNLLLMISSPIIFFLSTFGISDFALSTITYRKAKLIPDKLLPGTLNTQCVIPIAMMALSFISAIQVDLTTLLCCIGAQVVGAYIGPRFIVKLSENALRLGMGIGLLVAAMFILAGLLHLTPAAGTALALHGPKLAIAIGALFLFGILNNIGIGSFAPTMATVYALGLSPSVAFPIMMGACAFSVPIGSMQFIKYSQYSQKITLFTSTLGLLGVFAGVILIKYLDLSMLQWAVAAVLIYTGINMLAQRFKKPAPLIEQLQNT